MTAANHNITIEQGAGFAKVLRFVSGDTIPETIEGATVYGQMRTAYDSSTAIASFVCGVVSSVDRTISFGLPATATALIPKGSYVYDLFCRFSTGEPIRLIKGKARVEPRATVTT